MAFLSTKQYILIFCVSILPYVIDIFDPLALNSWPTAL